MWDVRVVAATFNQNDGPRMLRQQEFTPSLGFAELLADGWEPFAVDGGLVFLRRPNAESAP